VVAAVGMAGAGVVLKLGTSTLRQARRAKLPAAEDGAATHPLGQGLVVNLLSPHPWLFWLSVGGPLLVTAWRHGAIYSGAFLLGFYGLLVGSKVVRHAQRVPAPAQPAVVPRSARGLRRAATGCSGRAGNQFRTSPGRLTRRRPPRDLMGLDIGREVFTSTHPAPFSFFTDFRQYTPRHGRVGLSLRDRT